MADGEDFDLGGHRSRRHHFEPGASRPRRPRKSHREPGEGPSAHSSQTRASGGGNSSEDGGAPPDPDDFYGAGRMPNPTPLNADDLRGHGRSATTPEERGRDKHAEAMARFGIDPEAVKNAWRVRGMPVPGTYNPMLKEEVTPHGERCPYCRYISSLGDENTVRNYINDMNGIVQLCVMNTDNFEATAHALSSYWKTNVYEPRRAAGVACPKFTVEDAREHLQVMLLDGMSDGRETARNLRALEMAAKSCLLRYNSLTEETTLDKNAADVLLRMPTAKKALHETDWTRSRFRIPSVVRPEDVATVAPLLQLFSTRGRV